MTRKLSLLLASLVVGAFALLIASPVHAQATGNTTVSIDIPDIVILHYFNTVDVQIDAAAMGSFLTGGPTAIDEGVDGGLATENTGQFELNLGMIPTGLSNDPTSAVLLLQEAWGVRAIGNPGANTDLTITVPTPILANGGSQIAIAGAAVESGALSGPTILFPAPGLAPALIGDVRLTLNFTNTTAAGIHAGGVYTLTATNL